MSLMYLQSNQMSSVTYLFDISINLGHYQSYRSHPSCRCCARNVVSNLGLFMHKKRSVTYSHTTSEYINTIFWQWTSLTLRLAEDGNITRPKEMIIDAWYQNPINVLIWYFRPLRRHITFHGLWKRYQHFEHLLYQPFCCKTLWSCIRTYSKQLRDNTWLRRSLRHFPCLF